MANITCPQCSRFVDDSAKFCPGCKYNIKKYVKEMKKKGGTVSGSISFGSVYSKTSAGTDAIPELEFLKPAAQGKPEPVNEEPEIMTYEPEPEAPAYQEPTPVYQEPAPAPAPITYTHPAVAAAPMAPAAPAYERPASPVENISSVDPASLFPKETSFRPAYKPRVAVQAPAYDPNYKKNNAVEAAPAYEETAAPAYEEPVAAAPAAPVAPVPPAAPVIPVTPVAPAAPAAPVTPVAPAAPVTPVPVTPVATATPVTPVAPTVPVTPVAPAAPAVPPEALLYQQPAAPAAPAIPAYQPAAPAVPAYQPATPVTPVTPAVPAYQPAASAVPPEALLYQQPAAPAAPAIPAYQPAAPAAPAYQQATTVPLNRVTNYQAARQVQSVNPAAPAYQPVTGRTQPIPAVEGMFESAALNYGVSGGGALSGEITGPTILEKLRAEEEEKKANASIFESPSLRAAEKELKNGTRQPAGGLHGEISFDNFVPEERGSFGRASAYQIQQAAYVAAGQPGQQSSSVPPYAAQPGAGPGGMSYQMSASAAPSSPAYAPQATMPAYAATPGAAAGVPAFAAGPGMGNPFAPTNGAIPYITQTPANSGNPVLGGGGNPILGGASANPLLGG